MTGPDRRQRGAPYPSPQDALHDGGDAEELATDVADTPEAEKARPGAVSGHTVSTRVRIAGTNPADPDETEEESHEHGPELPQGAAARDPDL